MNKYFYNLIDEGGVASIELLILIEEGSYFYYLDQRYYVKEMSDNAINCYNDNNSDFTL